MGELLRKLNETLKKSEANHRDDIFRKNERVTALEADLINCDTRCQQLLAGNNESKKLIREKNSLIRNLKQALTLLQNPHKENLAHPILKFDTEVPEEKKKLQPNMA